MDWHRTFSHFVSPRANEIGVYCIRVVVWMIWLFLSSNWRCSIALITKECGWCHFYLFDWYIKLKDSGACGCNQLLEIGFAIWQNCVVVAKLESMGKDQSVLRPTYIGDQSKAWGYRLYYNWIWSLFQWVIFRTYLVFTQDTYTLDSIWISFSVLERLIMRISLILSVSICKIPLICLLFTSKHARALQRKIKSSI